MAGLAGTCRVDSNRLAYCSRAAPHISLEYCTVGEPAAPRTELSETHASHDKNTGDYTPVEQNSKAA
jgi:hypothetical protein